jgi:hypothetical protein
MTPDRKDAKYTVVELHSLWWGVCAGGRHYTGEVRVKGGSTVELRRKLSLKEAKELGETEGRMWLNRLQRDTNKFDSMEQLERHALKWCKENVEGDFLLLQDALNPSRVTAGRGPITERIPVMNQLAEAWDKVPNWERQGEVWKETYKAWDSLLKL